MIPELYKHQKEVIELAKNKNELAIFHGLGCISGNMTVTINQNGASKTKTFREAYEFYKNRQKDKLFARGLKEDGKIGLNKIYDIVFSGNKFCKRIHFNNGNILEATSDHEILTPLGFKSIDNGLQIGDKCLQQIHAVEGRFNFNNFGYHEIIITKIEDMGMIDTYDIKCESVHNFLANGIVVHNSGKSRSTIEIIRHEFNKEKKYRRTLILGPTAVIFNWKNEFLKFSKIEEQRIFVSSSGTGRDKKLLKAIENGAMIITINYEALCSANIKKILLAWQPEILVCDESHNLKNPSAVRSKVVFELARSTYKRIILTGTPILKNTMDAFMQFKILDLGKTFGANFFSFRARYFYDKNAAWAGKQNHFPLWTPHPAMEKELLDKIATKAHVVETKDCIDLPPYVNIVEFVDMTEEQRKAYEQMKDLFMAFVNDNMSNPAIASIAPVKALRMMQICAGHLKLDDGTIYNFKNTPKLKRLEELVEEIRFNHKFIIWAAFKEDIKAACDLMDSMGIRYVCITGDQDTVQKQTAVDLFQNDPLVTCVIANQRAGGTGITLTKASYSFVLSKNFSLGDNLQSRARNYRSGSAIHERIVNVDLTVKDSIEELVTTAINNKEEIGNKVLTWVKENKL